MKITNKAATIMFPGKGVQSLNEISRGAQYLKDYTMGPGATRLTDRSTQVNKYLAMIGRKARERLHRLERLDTSTIGGKTI